MPAFAAFAPSGVTGLSGEGVTINAGVNRWICGKCGSPMAATFDYLPTQIYIPIGVIDDADDLSPQVHCFAEQALSWLHMNDGVTKQTGTGRDTLLGG